MIKRKVSLKDRIPIYKIEDGCLITKTSCIAKVYELQMPELYARSLPELNEFNQLFERIIKTCGEDYIIHKQDIYNENYYQRETENESFLARSYEGKFHGRQFYDHKSYLIVIKYPKGMTIESIGSSLIRGNLVPKEVVEGKEEFLNTIHKVEHTLHSSDIKIKALKSNDLADYLGRYFNFGTSAILNDLQIKNDSIRVGEKEVLFYSTISSEVDLPKEVESHRNCDEFFDRSFTYPISIGLPYRHIVNTIVKKMDSTQLLSKLQSDRERIFSFSKKSKENQNLVGEYDAFLDAQVKDNKVPIYLHQNIMIWGLPNENRECENEISNALMKMDIHARRNVDVGNLFWSCCPGNAIELPSSEYQIQFSDVGSMYFPLETNPKSNGIEGLKFSERTYGIPISLDLWSAPMKDGRITNRNMFILGPSGSGKSFTVNSMARQWFEQGYHLTIIDVGGSYRRLTSYCNGKYFEYTKDKRMSFNPFYYDKKKGKNLEEYENLKTLVLTLWKGEEEKEDKTEHTILSNSILGYFEHIIATEKVSNFNAYYEYILDVFVPNMTSEEKTHFAISSFKIVLAPFYKGGEYDYLLNSKDEFSISDLPFCVFELDEIKDHPVIFPVVTLVIMDAFISKMRRQKEVRKVILIEEAWKAISSNGMAEFLKYLYKTVRKFNGAVGVITQEIEDIVDNPLVKDTIINNADTVILCDQSKYKNRFDKIEKLLALPKSEVKKVLSINAKKRNGDHYKEVYIKQGTRGVVVEVLVSTEEAMCYTTEAEESVAIDELAKKEGSVQGGIEQYLLQKNNAI